MAQYLSADLRIRVIRAVEGGMSRNAAARHSGVSIAGALRWMDVYLHTGRTAAKPRGGDRRSERIKAQRDFLMAAIEAAPDITLAGLRDRLIAELGERFALSTIHDFFRRRECPIFCVFVNWSMLPEKSKADDAFHGTIGRTAEGLRAA